MGKTKLGTIIINCISIGFIFTVMTIIGIAWQKNTSVIDKQKEQVVASTEKNSRFADIQLEISSGKAVLLDVRTPQEYYEGFYPESVNIPLSDLQAGRSLEDIEKTQTIYLYCRSGNRSQQAAKLLKERKYVSVVDLGGLPDVARIGGVLTKELSKLSKQAAVAQELLVQEKMISDVMTKLSQVHNTTEYEELIAESRLHQSGLSQFLRQREIKDRRSSLVGTFTSSTLQEQYDTYVKSGEVSETAARAVVISALEEYSKKADAISTDLGEQDLDEMVITVKNYLKKSLKQLNQAQKS